MAPIRVAVLLKTNFRGQWIIPQAEELRHRGHEVVVILPPGPGRLTTRLIERGFQVLDSPFDFRFRPTIGTLRGLWRLRRLLRRLQPDLLNYHLYASALAARIASVGLPLRRVHTVVGPLFLESAVVRAVERWLWRLDDVVICGTDYTSRLYGALGCPARRRPAVTPGIDTEHLSPPYSRHHATTRARLPEARPATAEPAHPEPSEAERVAANESRAKARAELGIREDVFMAIMIAYVYPPRRIVHKGRDLKGHDVLLEAWSAFHTRFPRSHLLLVGGGWTPAGEVHRRELIRDFRVLTDSSITWLESATDVRPCYRAADVSISPSLSEGHGAAVEAGAMAVPSIVSDAGGLPEVVDETSGWVVRKGDPAALADALEIAYREYETGALAGWGDRARQRTVALFDNRTAAVRVADIIEQVAR